MGSIHATSTQQLLRRLARRASTALSPTTSAVLVIAFVLWVLARPLIHLTGALASVVDTATALTVLLAAVLIESGRETTASGKGTDPRAGGDSPAA